MNNANSLKAPCAYIKLIKALLKNTDVQERSEFKIMEVLNSTQSNSEIILKLQCLYAKLIKALGKNTDIQ